jgi:hypothetical protein
MTLYSKKIIKERFLKYKNLSHIKKYPFFSIKNQFAGHLEMLVKIYLSQNLEIIGKKFVNLNKSLKHINLLPNITPGGIIVPKIETQLIYNSITSYCYKSLGNFAQNIEFVAPIAIRIKSGIVKDQSRPYQTSKLHTDAWVGMFLDGIFSIGVMGDFKNNGVQFFMPNLVSDDYFGELLNYDEGIKKFRGIKKIGQLKKSYIHMFDNIILHKTMSKKKALPRISIDFAFFLKNRKEMKFKNPDSKRFKYYPVQNYRDCGKHSLFKTFETVKDTEVRILKNLKGREGKFVKI